MNLKIVWSPGSTTTNSSSSTETTIPATGHHISTSEPDSFRPLKVSTSSSVKLQRSGETVTDSHLTAQSLSPTTSELTPEINDNQLENITDIYDPNQTVTPVHKYWTLPRNIATATKTQYLIENEEQLQKQDSRQSSHSHIHHHKPQTLNASTDRHIHRQIITDLPPPTSAKYIYETEDTKYFTLPTNSRETVTTTRKVIPAPPKSEGIGPVTESGIPLALKSVRL